jgi:quercetin dioxygenase-like cupin family protein
MTAPPGWDEPAQTPEFAEYTLVLKGTVIVEHAEGTVEIGAGQAFTCEPGEKVRYSSGPEGAEYVAVCLPAFSPDAANRAE